MSNAVGTFHAGSSRRDRVQLSPHRFTSNRHLSRPHLCLNLRGASTSGVDWSGQPWCIVQYRSARPNAARPPRCAAGFLRRQLDRSHRRQPGNIEEIARRPARGVPGANEPRPCRQMVRKFIYLGSPRMNKMTSIPNKSGDGREPMLHRTRHGPVRGERFSHGILRESANAWFRGSVSRSCDRGRIYCIKTCAQELRADRQREARRRYRATPVAAPCMQSEIAVTAPECERRALGQRGRGQAYRVFVIKIRDVPGGSQAISPKRFQPFRA